MPLNWIDVTDLSFNTLLLLERVQLSWLPGWVPDQEMALALQANPAVEWFIRHKCPEIIPWLDTLRQGSLSSKKVSSEAIRQAEIKILNCINDLVVYAVDPAIYDAQPFLGWDSDELRSLVDFSHKLVIDVGSGTGRLAFVAAEKAKAVFAVDPVENLRYYIKEKAFLGGFSNIYAVDGLISDLPFPDGFADVTMSGHVFGDLPEMEYEEMKRVTKAGGMIILCPGASVYEKQSHEYLISQGFDWSTFEEPRDGLKRKYWKTIE